MVDIVTRLGKGSPLTNAEVDANFTNLAEVSGVTGEPMGHEDRTTSTISFNASTRTFTIAPTASSFTVWCKGKKVVVSSAQTVVIPNTTGMHSIYYDANGTLSSKIGYFTFSTEAPTAYVYWNATTGAAPYFGDERHGVVLDWQTHEYLHRTRGAVIANGFLASGYTLNSSATNAATQIAIESGTFFDEDMKIDIVSTATPTAGTYQQNLLFPAKIPVLHLQGTSWVMDAPTDFPFKQGTSRPQYNSLSGGVWSTTDVGNNQHATTWILATNNLTYPVIAIIGQSATDNLGEAEAFSFADLTLTGFPSVEFRPLYKLIYKASDGYANSVNAQLVSIVDLRSVSAVGAAANPATDHGNLSGLSDDDHPQYLSVDTVRGSLTAAVKASFLPSQTSNAGKFLQTDGTATSWQALTSGNVTTALGFTPYNATNPSGFITGITSGNVTTALGFTPYNATNPSGYVTAAGARGAISVTGAGSYDSATGVINIVGGVTSFNTRTGAITLSSSDVTTALGFTPYNSTNPNGYLTGITSTQVTTALGYTPYNSSNPSGYITGITSGMVTTALGFTPYNNSNPSGYITSAALSPYLTTASAASTYLALSGGTIAGQLNVNNAGSATAVMRLWSAGSTIWSVGVGDSSGTNFNISADFGSLLVNKSSGNVTTPGQFYAGTSNLVLHVGNYNSYAPAISYSRFTGDINTLGVSNATSGIYNIGAGYTNGPGNTSLYGTLQAYWNGDIAVQFWHSYNGDSYWRKSIGGTFSGAAWRINLDSVNYSSYALPLSGGTITGNIVAANNNVGGVFGNLEIGYGGRYNTLQTKTSADTAWIQYGHSGPVGIAYGGGDTTIYGKAIFQGAVNVRPQAPNGILGLDTGDGNFDIWGISRDYYPSNSTAANAWGIRWDGDSNQIRFIGGGNVRVAFDLDDGATQINGNQVLHAGNYNSYALPLSGGTMSGDLTATRIRGVNNLVLNTYTTVNPSSNVYLYSQPNDRDSWIYLDSADTSSNWGIYHRQIDTAVSGLPANSLGFIGGGTSALQAWISLANGSANFSGALTQGGNQVLHAGNYSSYALPLSGGTATGQIISSANGNQLRFVRADGTTPAWTFHGWSGGLNIFSSTVSTVYIGRDGPGTSLDVYNGSLTQAGNQVLHAGNYTSYSPSLTGSGASGTWAIKSRSINAVRTSNTNFNDLSTALDTFTAGTNYIPSGGAYNQPADGDHHYLAWGGIEGSAVWAAQIDVNFYDDRVWFRRQYGSSWQAWRQFIHDGNYNSYSPTLTGGNASGTWGINVTGTAGSISGFNNPTTAPTANTIAYRDSAGDISAREIVLSSALQSAVPTVLVGMFPTTNQLVRMTPAAVASAIQTGASGSWGISVTGNARALDSGHYIYRTGSSGNLNTDFTNIPAGTMRHAGDDSSLANSPGGTWWFYDHYRHSNSSNAWGTQIAWGWEDNSNRLAQRNVSAGSWSGWVYYLNSANYSSYAVPISGGTMTGVLTTNHQGNGSPSIIVNSGGSENWRAINVRAAAGADNFGIGYSNSSHSAFGRNNLSFHCGAGDSIRFHSDGWDTLFEVAGSTGNAWFKKDIYFGGSSVYTFGRDVWAGAGGYPGYSFSGGNSRFGFSSTGGYIDVYTDGNFYAGIDLNSVNNLVLHAGNYNSYSPTLTGGNASGSWGISITGAAASAGSANVMPSTGYGNGTFTWRQESGTFAGQSGWASYLISNHGDGNTYYSQTIIMPFWSAPQYSRKQGSSTVVGPYVFITTENYTSYTVPVGGGTFTGSITSNGNVTAYSDERKKTNWRGFAEDFIEQLATVKSGTYDRTDMTLTQDGVSAQSLQQVMPNSVFADEHGMLSVNYGGAALASAVELAKDNVELRARIERLESLINKLIGD